MTVLWFVVIWVHNDLLDIKILFCSNVALPVLRAKSGEIFQGDMMSKYFTCGVRMLCLHVYICWMFRSHTCDKVRVYFNQLLIFIQLISVFGSHYLLQMGTRADSQKEFL